jgi:hypothetical protein
VTSCRRIALQTVIVGFFIIRTAISVMGETETLPRGHIKFTSIVTKKAGTLVVTTPNGATHQLNWLGVTGRSRSKRGMKSLSSWMKITHLKGKEGRHQHVTGKLIHLGMLKKEIKIQTAEGEKVFPLPEQGQKTKGIADGTLVTIELNEVGAAIDVHRADIGGRQHETSQRSSR